MREVGILDLGDVKYQGLDTAMAALDNLEEWAPLGSWAEMTDNGPVLQTRSILIRHPMWRDGRL